MKLPTDLAQLKKEVQQVIDHLAEHCPAETRLVLKTRKRWQLTLLSVMCQEGERRELDVCVDNLPEGAVLHGWLGDSILLSGKFDAQAFCDSMKARNVVIGVKALPSTREEYLKVFEDITGLAMDSEPLQGRELRRHEAKAGGTVATSFVFFPQIV